MKKITDHEAVLIAKLIGGQEISEFNESDQEILYEMYMKFSGLLKN